MFSQRPESFMKFGDLFFLNTALLTSPCSLFFRTLCDQCHLLKETSSKVCESSLLFCAYKLKGCHVYRFICYSPGKHLNNSLYLCIYFYIKSIVYYQTNELYTLWCSTLGVGDSENSAVNTVVDVICISTITVINTIKQSIINTIQ